MLAYSFLDKRIYIINSLTDILKNLLFNISELSILFNSLQYMQLPCELPLNCIQGILRTRCENLEIRSKLSSELEEFEPA